MTEKLNLYQRMNKIMEECGPIPKNGEVKDKSGKLLYEYTKHDDVTAALRPLMAKHGILALPTIKSIDRETVLDSYGKQTTKICIMIDVKFKNVDNPSEEEFIVCAGEAIDNQDKGIGKATSYALKNGMLKTFCLEGGEDIEDHQIEVKSINNGKQILNLPDPNDLNKLAKQLIDLIKLSGCDVEEFTKFHNISSKNLLSLKHSVDNFDNLLINFKDTKRILHGKENNE